MFHSDPSILRLRSSHEALTLLVGRGFESRPHHKFQIASRQVYLPVLARTGNFVSHPEGSLRSQATRRNHESAHQEWATSSGLWQHGL